jgi:hypothetical protein
MDRKRFVRCTPSPDPAVKRRPIIDFSSGYVRRALGFTPKQGDRRPWRVQQNYVADLAAMSLARMGDELAFVRNDRGARA